MSISESQKIFEGRVIKTATVIVLISFAITVATDADGFGRLDLLFVGPCALGVFVMFIFGWRRTKSAQRRIREWGWK